MHVIFAFFWFDNASSKNSMCTLSGLHRFCLIFFIFIFVSFFLFIIFIIHFRLPLVCGQQKRTFVECILLFYNEGVLQKKISKSLTRHYVMVLATQIWLSKNDFFYCRILLDCPLIPPKLSPLSLVIIVQLSIFFSLSRSLKLFGEVNPLKCKKKWYFNV